MITLRQPDPNHLKVAVLLKFRNCPYTQFEAKNTKLATIAETIVLNTTIYKFDLKTATCMCIASVNGTLNTMGFCFDHQSLSAVKGERNFQVIRKINSLLAGTFFFVK